VPLLRGGTARRASSERTAWTRPSDSPTVSVRQKMSDPAHRRWCSAAGPRRPFRRTDVCRLEHPFGLFRLAQRAPLHVGLRLEGTAILPGQEVASRKISSHSEPAPCALIPAWANGKDLLLITPPTHFVAIVIALSSRRSFCKPLPLATIG
jgi:hypothetical protein